MSEKMTPEEVVRAWSDAYVSKDLDATSALMSEDFIRLGDSTHWTPIGKHDWKEIMVNFFTAFPDWSWDMTSLIASGDRVVCELLKKVLLPILIRSCRAWFCPRREKRLLTTTVIALKLKMASLQRFVRT